MPSQKQGSIDIIRETRRLVSGLGDKKRFEIAKRHLEDALNYKTPRLDTYSNHLSKRFKICYNIQTSIIWIRFLMILSYVFMYAVIAINEKKIEQGISYICLVLFWLDTGMEVYHKKFEVLRK